MMKKTSFLQYMRSFLEVAIHHIKHRQIILTIYRDTNTELKHEYLCTCGKMWILDYGYSELDEKNTFDHSKTVMLDCRTDEEWRETLR